MATVKYSGPIASFHCPTNAEIRSLKVHFSPKQEGTGDPSPENVRPIVGWDGVEVYRNDSTTNYEFGVLGKNKLDVSSFIGGEHIKSDGSIAQNSEFRRTDYLHLTPSDYVYSATKTDGTTAYVRVCGYNKSKTFVAQLGEQLKGSGNYEMAFTVPENVYYIILQSYKANTNEQLELGSSATAYEPYSSNNTVYGGYVDLANGEVVAEWAEEDLGAFNYSIANAQYGSFYFSHPTFNVYVSRSTPANMYVDKISVVDSNTFNTKADIPGYYMHCGNSNNELYIMSPNFVGLTGNELKEAVTGYKIVYKLATPIHYSLAPTQLQTFLGQNNVWSNADYVEVEYDLHETQTLLQRKAFIMANQPHIESASGAIASFNTDLRAALQSCKVGFMPVQEGSGDPSPTNVRTISG